MFPNSRLSQQRGSMLIIALFVIIIMAMLGLTAVKLLNSAADKVTHEVYGLRAFAAAQSSMDKVLEKAFPLSQDGTGACNVDITNYGNTPGLEFCYAIARCSLTQGFVGESSKYYRFVSTGVCSAGDITASRTIAVDAKVD